MLPYTPVLPYPLTDEEPEQEYESIVCHNIKLALILDEVAYLISQYPDCALAQAIQDVLPK